MKGDTLYISGPMTGQPDNNRPLFEAAKVALEKMGYQVVSPVDLDEAEGVPVDGDGWSSTDEEYEGFMARDLELLDTVDGIVMLPGWSKSGGAGREGRKVRDRGKPMFMWNPDTPSILITLPRWLFNEFHTVERLKREGA